MHSILIVEDSRTQREILRQFLTRHKFSVTAVKDGLEALKAIKRNPPDLVLLDIIMPHVNGYEVCRHLKSNPKTHDIQVILCSSKDSQIDRYWGLKQGADAYLIKPFTAKDLLVTIKQLISVRSEA
ncbi:response regulator [Spirulina sp. CS-785/01]|uniref:response regulator n=1 Tax=Spirulina sp. CS-785/01 TaxID=3021716 RepID=UPI002330E511|nr:response regulator [Spirulina sp. CS-785/01]MDB9312044.1 response regulator [Spirulina sp. CS-785/01]